jgi:hypothetical protein
MSGGTTGGMIGGPGACPDWNALVALRDRADLAGLEAEPAEWAAALTHLDGCPRCRRQAMAADPLLVFRRLPGAERPAAEESAEAEAMVQAVSAMRAAGRLESRRRFAGWRRWAAAAVLALASLSVGRDKAPLLAPPPAPPEAALPATASPAAGGANVMNTGAATLERLDSSDARVYQLNGKDLSVFMIVDNKLDV